MKDYELLDAVGGIDAEYVNAADRSAVRKRTSHKFRWIAAAACICLVAAGSFGAIKMGLFGGKAGSGSRGKEGLTYMSYAGPVFPLSALETDLDITAERTIDFDFSPYNSRTDTYKDENNKAISYETYNSKSIITDRYTLSNHSGEDKALTLVYPFAASLNSSTDVKPIITVNGRQTETTCYIGPYSGGFMGVVGDPDDKSTVNLSEISSWEGYKALIEGGYQALAFDEFPKMNRPVVIYELKNRYGEKSEAAQAPTLNMEFHIDYNKTTILTYGFNSATVDIDTGYCARGTHVPQPENPDYGESAFLIVLGQDIGEYHLNAYIDGACETELENAGAEVVRYESTLEKIVENLSELYLKSYEPVLYGADGKSLLSTVPKDDFVGLASEMIYGYGLLSENPKDRYWDGMLENIFSETQSNGRVMYLAFQATVPAGGSAVVSAEMIKHASIDFIGENIHRNGYDMVTGLGSALSFTKQTASVSNTESIEIIRQNFGFDINKGITAVELDLNEPHYYIEIQKKGK